MNITNLVIEITRQCNIECAHCMRGDQEIVDIDFEHITTLLEQISYISNVTFTGGEPSLNVPAITFFREEAQRLNVDIGNFYIVTNGIKISEAFVIECIKLYNLCNDNEMTFVEISNDVYHVDEADYDIGLLEALKFFRKRNKEDSFNYYNGQSLITEGRGESLGDRPNSVSEIVDTESLYDIEMYLNCNGDIINGCDWSYKSQEDWILCKVENLKTFYNNLKEKEYV